jgi:hypothetical protein
MLRVMTAARDAGLGLRVMKPPNASWTFRGDKVCE